MTFDYPFLLSAFIIFIFMFLLDIFSPLKKYRQKLPEKIKKKLLFSSFLFRMYLAFSIIALSGPRWGTNFYVSEYRRDLDAILAIDVSRSMDIRDTQTGATRLEHGLSIARDSLLYATGIRFAAVIGRSKGYLSVPLSYDNEAVLNFIESLGNSSLTGRSTNLESLVETAALSFQNIFPARKVIVLISDGESHSGILRNALNICVTNGIIVTTVAVGSNEGGRVPLENFPEETLPSMSGGLASSIISRRDSATMRMAAERTGGIYIDANREDAASVLSAHLLSIAQNTKAGSKQTEQKQHRTFFVILAILTYGAYRAVPRISAEKFFPVRKKLPLVSMIAVSLLLISCSKGKILLLEANYLISQGRYDEAVIPCIQALEYKDAAPYAEYSLGLTLNSIDESAAALKRYDNSMKMLESLSGNEHSELRYRNYYNSGIIYFENGDFLSAARAFKEALRADPEKLDAKRNLELSLISIVTEAAAERGKEKQNNTREILFDYLKEQEQQYWKSMEWAAEEDFSGPDY
jgi:Ca-activated chloride channel family protein